MRRRWLVVALATIAGLVAAVAGSFLVKSSYEATATLRVATGLLPGESVQFDSVEYADRLMNTYRQLALGRPLRRAVAREANQAELPSVTVEIPANTELMNMTVRAADVRLAAREANLVAREVVGRARESADRRAGAAADAFEPRLEALERDLTDTRAELEAARAAASPGQIAALGERAALQEDAYRRLLEESTAAQSAATTRATSVSVEQAATPPSSPSRPHLALVLALGAILGSVGGVGLAFLGKALDRRVYAQDEPAELDDVFVAAEIPRAPRREARDIASLFNSNSPQREAFAMLRTNLGALNGGSRDHAILVTSPEPGAGKTTVTANLGAAMARAGRRVVLVDADLRRPRLHLVFGLSNESGLSALLVSDG